MEFKIGCNYWASNAGTEMWRDYDSDTVRGDFSILQSNGIDYLRVFPNWRDFQPVSAILGGGHAYQKYVMADEKCASNLYYLDDKMLDRFSDFCKIAREYNLKLIVGLITGWMSGRLFIPPILWDKNIYTDPVAQRFEQKFIRGFVERFKGEKAIYAWDLGNECNCMDSIKSRDEADNWTMLITNAIKAVDSSRPVISGMHSLDISRGWTIGDQSASADVLTTHPYPFWVSHCSEAEVTSIQTLMHATCETKYYSNIGKKPCLVEEIGTMGPMVCDDETAAGFLRVNLYSNWANGAQGLFWWCAHDQTELMFSPYDANMCETELGLLNKSLEPKPVLTEIKKFSQWLKTIDFELPEAAEDGVCLLTNGQDNWGIAYMSYVLSKQAGANISFAYADGELPEADVYLLPSVSGINPLSAQKWKALKQRVYNGAVLYISNDDAVLSEFKEFTGVRVRNSRTYDDRGCFVLNNKSIEYSRTRCLELIPESAESLLYDESGQPLMTSAGYGKGTVIYLNFPLEKNLVGVYDAFSGDSYEIYRALFKDKLREHIVSCSDKNIGITLHCKADCCYAVIINYSADTVKLNLSVRTDYSISRVIKGNTKKLLALNTAIIELMKK